MAHPYVSGPVFTAVAGPLKLGTTDRVGGHAAAHESWGVSPARSSMIMVMNASGSWNPLALVRIRPIYRRECQVLCVSGVF